LMAWSGLPRRLAPPHNDGGWALFVIASEARQSRSVGCERQRFIVCSLRSACGRRIATSAFASSQPHQLFRGLLSVHSLYGLHVRQVPYRTFYTRGFSRFVASTTAPVASGRSESGRAGFAPAGKQRLCMAHSDWLLEKRPAPASHSLDFAQSRAKHLATTLFLAQGA